MTEIHHGLQNAEETQLFTVLPFSFIDFQYLSGNAAVHYQDNGNMASLSYENLVGGDIVLLIIFLLSYILFVWVAMGISLYLVVHRPNDRQSEASFEQR